MPLHADALFHPSALIGVHPWSLTLVPKLLLALHSMLGGTALYVLFRILSIQCVILWKQYDF
jgi:hypothetical protein